LAGAGHDGGLVKKPAPGRGLPPVVTSTSAAIAARRRSPDPLAMRAVMTGPSPRRLVLRAPLGATRRAGEIATACRESWRPRRRGKAACNLARVVKEMMQARDDELQVGVVEDDDGRLAAEL